MAKTLTEDEIAGKRQDLIAVATQILEKEGFQALTLRRLATDAGISRSTPYLYFQDKSDLLNKVCVEAFKYLISLCRDAMAPQDGILDQLTALGRCYMQFGVDRPVLYRLVFAPENPDDEISPEVQEIAEEYRSLFQGPMQQAYEKGYFTVPPDRLGPVLWASMHGVLCLRWAGHLTEEDAFRQVRDDMEMILSIGFINREKIEEINSVIKTRVKQESR